MADKIDFFWEIFEAISGGTGEGITDALNALAKSDRGKVETYFSEVIDQTVFGTEDYNRFRKFLVDLFATHRTLTSQSIAYSDPHAMSNSDLDELFRSFGYTHSPQLRSFDENPLEQKVQFFLDLVNLYKVKGTPQSLVDVLQYYGVTEIDIYEFILKLRTPGELIFDGKAVSGTSVDPDNIQILYNNMTSGDPHWLYTSQQILQLNETNKINLPSQTPYIGIQPIIDVDRAEFSIITRYIQDQYDLWSSGGTLPLNADITYIGEVRSLLELYLSTIYMFNQNFEAGVDQDPCNFLCYDGTSTSSVEILDEFSTLTTPPFRRCDLNSNTPPFVYDTTSGLYIPSSYCEDSKLTQYYDDFTRSSSSNFLVDKNTAGTVLNLVNPSLKSSLDGAGEPIEVLDSLLYDLAIWVRTNIGAGFINFAFILFGLTELFNTLKNVIDFFKPYRARLILLESLQIRNRLFNTIVIEDQLSLDTHLELHDYLTGNSIACCTSDSTSTPICTGDEITRCHRELVITPPSSVTWRHIWAVDTNYDVNDIVITGASPGDQFICTQAHISKTTNKPGVGGAWTSFWELYGQIVCTDTTGVNASVYSRETFDCGSYFDIGAVTDLPEDVFVQYEEDIHDQLRCPRDGSAFVVSEILSSTHEINTTRIASGVISDNITFTTPQSNTNYSIAATLRNESGSFSVYDFIVTSKSTTGFILTFSGEIDSTDYYVDWYVSDSTNATITQLNENEQIQTIPLNNSCQDSTDYSIAATLRNDIDSSASVYAWTIVEKKSDSFSIRFSGPLDSTNFMLEWIICEGVAEGNYNVSPGVTQVVVPIPSSIGYDSYPVLATLASDDINSSVYSAPIVTDKTINNFTLQFSGTIDTTGNYFVSWIIPEDHSDIAGFEYYQTGGFRDFDEDGRFDCTHGFDYVNISVEDVSGFILRENADFLLQETGDRILL